MASSVLKRNWNLSDALTEHFKHKCDFSDALTEQYFHLVYKKYGIPFPDDASWKEVKIPSLNGHTKMFNEIPNMLFDIADMFEDARVEELVKKCERLQLNSGNLYAQFNGTITVLLDKELTWGKVVVFFAFAVSFAIYLCTNDKSHLSARVCGWAAHVLRSRLLPWIDANGGWVSISDLYALFYCLRVPAHCIQCLLSHSIVGWNAKFSP